MACSLKAGFSIYGSADNRAKGTLRVCSSLQLKESISIDYSGKALHLSDTNLNIKIPKFDPVNVPQSICISKSLRWWEKSLHPNMVEIQSAQHLVRSLCNAGDNLVILDFYSPGCGGCKTLHPKICQLAEMNPDAIFLKVNYEEHKEMCYALNVHVLPFFRFYRGAQGKLCSFSCTNATIKKFKDSLSKHGTDRCSIGPTKGLDESELVKLASIGLMSRDLVIGSLSKEGNEMVMS